jgi:drug/metabolite transporter (DMT)-like permease
MQKGIIYMMISVVGFSLMNLIVKFLPRIPATELVLFRSIVSLVLSLAMIRHKKLNPFGNNKKWLILRGVFGVIGLTTFFYTLQHLPIASAITIQYLSPIFTALFAIFLLGERMRSVQWFFFFIAFGGIAVIKGFDSNISTFLFLMGLISAIFSGLAYNAIRKLKDSDHPVVVVFYFPLIATPIMALVSAFNWVTPIGWEWLLLLLMGVFTQIAQVNMTKAYQAAPLNKVAPFKYAGVVLALAFDVWIFGISYSWAILLGIAMVIGGVVLNLLQKSSSKPIG